MNKADAPQFLIPVENIESPRKQRLFESGHMKLLVLYLVQQAPKHGYELMKDIGEIVGGGYSPSAGTIYPTLNYLEDMQFISAQKTAGRKQYSIEPEGGRYLETQQVQLQHVLDRFETRREIQNNQQLIDIRRAMENLKTALKLKLKTDSMTAEQVRNIAEKIDHAAIEIGRL